MDLAYIRNRLEAAWMYGYSTGLRETKEKRASIQKLLDKLKAEGKMVSITIEDE